MLKDILIASFIFFIGAMGAVSKSGQFSMKKVLIWWASISILYILFRIFT
jgi:hypothetical protein